MKPIPISQLGDYVVSLSYQKGYVADLNYNLFNLPPVLNGNVITNINLSSLANPPIFNYRSPTFTDPESDALVFTFEGLANQSLISANQVDTNAFMITADQRKITSLDNDKIYSLKVTLNEQGKTEPSWTTTIQVNLSYVQLENH